tara:strand:+ start:453 stop:794 length:342 start_codon:yes stop_codon:yes gene_type:complete
LDKSTINLVRVSAVIVIFAAIATIFQDELRNFKVRVQEEIEFREKIKRNQELENNNYENYFLELNKRELEEKKYFIEANKCRDLQDVTKDEYFDQSYKECMKSKGYDPYSFYK